MPPRVYVTLIGLAGKSTLLDVLAGRVKQGWFRRVM